VFEYLGLYAAFLQGLAQKLFVIEADGYLTALGPESFGQV